jgi:hypothetical protein
MIVGPNVARHHLPVSVGSQAISFLPPVLAEPQGPSFFPHVDGFSLFFSPRVIIFHSFFSFTSQLFALPFVSNPADHEGLLQHRCFLMKTRLSSACAQSLPCFAGNTFPLPSPPCQPGCAFLGGSAVLVAVHACHGSGLLHRVAISLFRNRSYLSKMSSIASCFLSIEKILILEDSHSGDIISKHYPSMDSRASAPPYPMAFLISQRSP